MKRSDLVAILNGLKYRLNKFDVDELVDKFVHHNIDKKQTNKLIEDIYELTEDFIILHCEKPKK